MLGDKELNRIHERESGHCLTKVDSSSACTQAATDLRKLGGQKVLKVGDDALALGATPLNETTVLVAWGDQNGAQI